MLLTPVYLGRSTQPNLHDDSTWQQRAMLIVVIVVDGSMNLSSGYCISYG